MSLFNRLFGSKPAEDLSETYNGLRIIVAPMPEGSKFRLAARIEKDVDGIVQVYQVIRADTFGDLTQAQAVSLAKAKQVIDEQGKSLFKAAQKPD
ncbi:HlyU family transcriptional regulator [Yoonia sp. MH D7]